jgi:hypothetical protein
MLVQVDQDEILMPKKYFSAGCAIASARHGSDPRHDGGGKEGNRLKHFAQRLSFDFQCPSPVMPVQRVLACLARSIERQQLQNVSFLGAEGRGIGQMLRQRLVEI